MVAFMVRIMQSKQGLRKQILTKRRNLDPSEVKNLSRKICERILQMDIYKEAKNICCYMPINKEADVTELFQTAWKQGKALWLPVTKDGEMEFFLYAEGTSLRSGNYGIPEPDCQEKLQPDEKTLIIMPGAVFSEEGDRIGYGGGYYDKYLSKYSCCRTCAAAYGFQVVKELPAEVHDIRPEFIVTEEKVICSQAKK